LIEANHAVVLGTNNAHLPRLISFFAEALFREAVPTDHPVMSRILSIVREIQVGKKFAYIYRCSSPKISNKQFYFFPEKRHDVSGDHNAVDNRSTAGASRCT